MKNQGLTNLRESAKKNNKNAATNKLSPPPGMNQLNDIEKAEVKEKTTRQIYQQPAYHYPGQV